MDLPVRMTPDRILSLSIGRLLKQGAYGVDDFGSCEYINADGNLKCAVGVLLDDSVCVEMQALGDGIRTIQEELEEDDNIDILPTWFRSMSPLLYAMQVIHDSSARRSESFSEPFMDMILRMGEINVAEHEVTCF